MNLTPKQLDNMKRFYMALISTFLLFITLARFGVTNEVDLILLFVLPAFNMIVLSYLLFVVDKKEDEKNE